jgi:hypothetical protein
LTDRSLAAANHPKPPPNRRRRWLVVYGGYAAFDSSPPAIIVVAKPDISIVAHQEEAVYLADHVLLLTKRPTKVAEILDYNEARPRTIETLSQPSFVAAKKLSMEIFQREVRR